MSVFEAQHRSESMAARVAFTLIENACALWGMRTEAARAEGLPDLQACILVRIANSPEQELTVGGLAGALHLTAPTVSDSLKALVTKGYLKRRKNPLDGRVVFFSCTRKGQTAADRLSEWPSRMEETISGLDQGHQQALMGALTFMLRRQIEDGLEIDPLVVDARNRAEARQGQFEDWVAMGIFLTFLSGADAFVSAHLRDFPDPIDVQVGPSPEGGVQVAARLRLDFLR